MVPLALALRDQFRLAVEDPPDEAALFRSYGIFELYRRQAEQLQARPEPTSGRPEPTRAPGSMEWLAEQKKSD
jgi:hypothetical protein